MAEEVLSGGNYTRIGTCEMCGEESNQAGGGHIICTRCEDVWSQELRALEPNETASKAWDRAKRICKLKAKIANLKKEKWALEDRVAELEKELGQFKEDNKVNLVTSNVKSVSPADYIVVSSGGLCVTSTINGNVVQHKMGKYGTLRMSTDGRIYAELSTPDWLAFARFGKIVMFNEGILLTEEERKFIAEFAEDEYEASRPKENGIVVAAVDSSCHTDCGAYTMGKWGKLSMLAGHIYADAFSGWLAQTDAKGAVIKYNDGVQLTGDEREFISMFAKAEVAKANG